MTRHSRNTAAQPATRGVDMLVPSSKKKAESDEVPKIVGTVAAARERVERIDVPGATRSGLKRPSLVGPRLLKAAIPSGLSAVLSREIGLAGHELGLSAP